MKIDQVHNTSQYAYQTGKTFIDALKTFDITAFLIQYKLLHACNHRIVAKQANPVLDALYDCKVLRINQMKMHY